MLQQRGIRSSRSESPGLSVNAHQAGHYVVEADQFSRPVWALHSEKDFCWVLVVMDAEIERALPGDLDLLCDEIATMGEGGGGCSRSLSVTRFLVACGCGFA